MKSLSYQLYSPFALTRVMSCGGKRAGQDAIIWVHYMDQLLTSYLPCHWEGNL